MNPSRKVIMITFIALIMLPTVTSAKAEQTDIYHTQTKIVAKYSQPLERQNEEWVWGKCNLVFIPENNIVSFHALLKTETGETINYRLTDLIGLRYNVYSDTWLINGVYEVKYADEIHYVESELAYSVRWNIIGTIRFPELGDGELGSTIGPAYSPAYSNPPIID